VEKTLVIFLYYQVCCLIGALFLLIGYSILAGKIKTNRLIRLFFYSVILLSVVTGCATPKTEFSTFAQAGGAYAVAVDKLLGAAGAAQVDSTSWSMVADKEDGTWNTANYKKLNEADLYRLQEIKRLSWHAQLLGQYFGMLESLATSDAPQQTKDAIGGVIKGLQILNLQLPQGVPALPAIGEAVVDLKIRQALQDELNARKEIIRAELYLQEKLLKVLSGDITHALKSQRQKQEETLILKPLSERGALTDPEKWVAARHKIVFANRAVDELSQASQVATKLRQAFESLLSGEVTVGRLNALITDIQALLLIAETIKS
jgi:hypothetical protein